MRNGRFSIGTLCGLTVLVATALPATVGAQELEEIVVTAQKREQSLQDVPISVVAVGGATIDDQAIADLEGLAQLVPNVTITKAATGDQLFIRGIGSGFNPGFEQSVGQFIDGIYHGRGFQSRAGFLDIERVEVLRGPQSTYFGNNTIGGALNITTRRPTDEFEGYAQVFYEPDLGERSIEVAGGGPIMDTVGVRVAARLSGMDGYLENDLQRRDEPNEDEKVARATFTWQPLDELDGTFKIEHGSFKTKGRATQTTNCQPTDVPVSATSTCTLVRSLNGTPFLPGGYEDNFDDTKSEGAILYPPVPPFTSTLPPPFLPVRRFPTVTPALAQRFGRNNEDLKTKNYTMAWNYTWGEHTITSVTGLSGYDQNRGRDLDFMPVPVIHESTDEEFDQWSQELRIVSPTGGTIEYLAGFYWQTSDLRIREQAEFLLPAIALPPFGPLPAATIPSTAAAGISDHQQDEETWGVFAAVTWNVMDNLRFTLGLRYTDVEKEIDRVQIFSPIGNPNVVLPAVPAFNAVFGWNQHDYTAQRSDDDFTPSVNVQYDFTDNISGYFSFAQGFKAGGFDQQNRQGLANSNDGGQFDPESVDAYEIGFKTTWLGGTANLNIAIFRDEYKDLQVVGFDGTVNFLVDNAAAATTQGVEVDARWAFNDHFTAGASFSYLDATYDDFTRAQCTAAQQVAANLAGIANGTNRPGASVRNCTQDLTDADLQYAPEWSGNFSLQYAQPLTDAVQFVGQVDVAFTDDFFIRADNDPNLIQDSFAKVNLRLALGSPDGTWDVALIGRNLNDEMTTHSADDVPLSSGTYFRFTDRPRQVGVQARYRW